jgi:hypothetical protein
MYPTTFQTYSGMSADILRYIQKVVGYVSDVIDDI